MSLSELGRNGHYQGQEEHFYGRRNVNRLENTRNSALHYSNGQVDRTPTPTGDEQYRQLTSDQIEDPLRKDFENLRRNLENVRQKSLIKRAGVREYLSHPTKDRDQRILGNEGIDNIHEKSISQLDKSLERGRQDKWSRHSDAQNKHEISIAFESEVEKKLWQERLKRSSSRERIRVKDIEKQLEKERLLLKQDASTYQYQTRSPRTRQQADFGGNLNSSHHTSNYRTGAAEGNSDYDNPTQKSRQYTSIPLSESAQTPKEIPQKNFAKSPSQNNQIQTVEINATSKKAEYDMEGFQRELQKLREDNRRMRDELAKIQSNINKEASSSNTNYQVAQSPRTRNRNILREAQTSYRQEEPVRGSSPQRQSPRRAGLQREDVKPVTPNRGSPRNELNRSFDQRLSQKQSPVKNGRPSTQEAFYPQKVARSRDERESSVHRSISRGRQQNNPQQKTEDISKLVYDVKYKVHSKLKENEERMLLSGQEKGSKRPTSSTYHPKFEAVEQVTSRSKKDPKTPRGTVPEFLKTTKVPETSTLLYYGLGSRPSAELHRLVEQSQEETLRPSRNRSALGRRGKR